MTAKDLKNALLQEAVQGKLVPQIASEGNARDLLEEIRKERGESLPLASARKRSSATPSAGTNAARNARFAPITEDEIPFEIPENWCWCRLIDVLKDKPSNGISPKEVKYETKIRSLSLSATTSGVFDSNAFKYVELDNNTASKYWLKKNDLLIQRSNSRELVGTSCIYYGDDNLFIYPDLMMRMQVQQNIKLAYIDYVLKSPHVRNYFSKNASGTSDSMPKINQTIVCNTLIPLPPLAEQKRIVSELEKFMPLIEEYGKKETELKAFNEQICTLTKKAILQEAVQGKLVPQIAAEGNAKDLLEEIKKEKAKVAGKASSTSFASKTRAKEFPPIIDDEIPFDIPENWCWCRLGYICQLIDGEKVQNVNLPLLDAKYLRGKKQAEFLSVGKLAQINDLLILVDGENSGEVFINKENGIMGSTFKKLIINKKLYLPYVLAFISMNKDLLRNSKKGAAIPHLNKDIFFGLLLPLPPLEEQKRIVAAIEKMLSLCEKLGE